VYLAHKWLTRFARRSPPFYTAAGEQLLPHLMRLGAANARELSRIITEQFPDAMVSDIEASIAAFTAGKRRSEAALEKRPKKVMPNKHKRKLRRIRDGLT